MTEPNLDWQDGLPVLHWRDQSWRLDRHWLESNGLYISGSHRYGLIQCGSAFRLQTMDGEVIMEDQVAYEAVGRAIRDHQWPLPIQDRCTWTADGTGLQLALRHCTTGAGGRMEYLELRGCRVTGLPEVEILRLMDILGGEENIEVPQIQVTRCLLVDTHLSGDLQMVAPVVWGVSLREEVRYQCQILVLTYGRPMESFEDCHRQTTAEYVMTPFLRNYRRTENGYVLMGEDEEVPEGYPGVDPGHGYRPLRYAESPEWWVGVRPPPGGSYLATLVTRPLTVWTRTRAKSARS